MGEFSSESLARRLAIGRATGDWGYEPLEGELKKRELVLTVTGQRTHLTPSTYTLKPCFAAGLFLSACARSSGSRVAYAGGGGGYSPCSRRNAWRESELGRKRSSRQREIN